MSGITLGFTIETPLASDPSFPSGYSTNAFIVPGFDFGRNWSYSVIHDSTNSGIAITDLTTMNVIRTATLPQLYAGTSFGSPPGSPHYNPNGNSIYDVAAGSNTDLYILTAGTGGLPNEFTRFTRVDQNTLKVTGEFYIDTAFPPPLHNVMGGGGIVNTTSTHTLVAYTSNSGLNIGAQVFDGTGMLPIGIGPAHPNYNPGNNFTLIPGKKYVDGSCDFLVINAQHTAGGTLIDIWRVHITNSLVMTSTLTGTVNVAGIVPAGVDLYAGEANYDPVHDTIIMSVSNQFTFNTAPSWIMSVNYDGSINWWNAQAAAAWSGAGHSDLSGTTYTTGDSMNLTTYDTATGDIVYTGGIIVMGTGAGSFYRIWDASRLKYWTYALSRGFVRVDFITHDVILTDAELFFTPQGAFLDFAVEANRRLFVASGGTPQWMTRDGSLPFGDAPQVYLTTLGPPLDFTQNNGPGGGFPVTGVINAAAGPGCSPYYITEAAGPASRPEWRLSVSDDGSRTWSRLVKPRAIGATGEYKTRLRWLKMGQFRQRVIKLECTDPVRRNIIGIYMDNEQGMN